jgi:quercetin dioxygenase-like cupin family protein
MKRSQKSIMGINKVGNTAKSIVAQAAKLSELVDYQDGSIVSKEIIKNEKGTVTLFAFDKGQGLSEHTAPFDALVYNFDGKADVIIEGKPHLLEAGEIIIMPANKPHALKAIERFKMLLVMVRS